jgi:hypothetical protein
MLEAVASRPITINLSMATIQTHRFHACGRNVCRRRSALDSYERCG